MVRECISDIQRVNPVGLKCVVEKERYIYDRDMPHLSFEIEDVKVGDSLIGLIVENRLDSRSPYLALSL